MSNGRDWHSFNDAWRNREAERRFDQVLSALVRIIHPPKRFWWTVFLGALVSGLLLAPESSFSNRVRELRYTLQDAVIAFPDILIEAADAYELFTPLLIFLVGLIVFVWRHRIHIDFNEDELDTIRRQSEEERHFVLLKTIANSSYLSGWLSILLTIFGAMLGWMLGTVAT